MTKSKAEYNTAMQLANEYIADGKEEIGVMKDRQSERVLE